MRKNRHAFRWLLPACLAAFSGLLSPDTLADRPLVAVASNFEPAMEELVLAFERQDGHRIKVSYGSTGKHYAQIINGAPYDAFLAADVERPRRLEEAGFTVAGSRMTYAIGRLALWSPRPDLVGDGPRTLRDGDYRFLAIANPRIAPYGRAAEQALRQLGLWEALQPRIVRGENIAQAYAFVRSGNAELGFVAHSQLANGEEGNGSSWLVPAEFHDPIEQQAVLLKERPVARAFLAFLGGSQAAAVIVARGYALP